MRAMLFASSLTVLAGIGLVFPGAAWPAVVAAAALIIAWLYLSMRDAEHDPGFDGTELEGDTFIDLEVETGIGEDARR